MDSAEKWGYDKGKGGISMYHTAKSGKKRKKRRLLRLCFLFVLLWAAALGLLVLSWSLPGPKAEELTLVYHGQPRQLPVQGQTAGELLQSLGLAMTEEDVASLPLDTVLKPNMVFTVNRYQTRQEVYTISIPPETQYRLDDALAFGKEAVLIPGVPGEMRCSAMVDYVNGTEVRREVTGKQLLYPAQNELIAMGTRENSIPTAGSGYLWLPEGQVLTYTHTAQAEATGFTCADVGAMPDAQPGTVAVDPAFIPPGTRLFIMAADGSHVYGIAQAVASDAMEGTRIDLCFSTREEQEAFDRKSCILYFLG